MPFASVTVSSETSWTATHTIDLPAIRQPGDHLLAVFATNGDGSSFAVPDDWTAVTSANLFSDDNGQVHLWLIELDGSEADTLVVTNAGFNKSVTHVIRYTGQRQGVVEGTSWDVVLSSRISSTVIDPPSLTATWGSAANTWTAIAVGAPNGATVDTYPTDYVDTQDDTNSVFVATCHDDVTAATEDPAAFTLSNSNVCRAITFVMRPAATVIAGAQVATTAAEAYDPDADPPTVFAAAEVATCAAEAYWAHPPNVPVASGLTIEWDFDGDGDFDETVEDISAKVLQGWCRRGRNYASQLTGRSTPGEMRLTVRNDDGAFNLFKTDSPLNTDPYSLKAGRLLRVRTTESAPTDPAELVRDLFGGSGPLAAADTLEAWTTRTTAGFSEFSGNAIADGPPVPTAPSLGSQDPDAMTWTLDNSSVGTYALRPADGETIAVSGTPTELQFGSAATTHTITLQASGIDAGDLIAIWFATAESSDVGAPTTPTGYTQHASSGNSGSFRPRITCVYKVADGTEESDDVDFVIGSSGEGYAVAVVFSGVDQTTPFDVAAPTVVEGTDDPNPPALTPATGQSWVITAAAGNLPAGTGAVTYSTGYTGIFDQVGDAASLAIAYDEMAATDSGTDHIETLPIGASNYYAQVVVPERDTTNEVGMVFHWTDIDNYGVVYFDDGNVTIRQIAAGVETTLATTGCENRSKRALGLAVNGTSLIAYVDGVEELSATTALSATSTGGIWGRWFSQRAPNLSEYRVWDRSRIIQSWDSVDQSGVLATMRVTGVRPFITRNGERKAEIHAEGALHLLDREIDPPESTGPNAVQSAGISAGHGIGNILHKVGLLQPPSALAEGDIPLGSVGFERQRAIGVARALESTEAGFLYEDTMGGVCFDARSARTGTAVVATFTDDALVPGFPFEIPEQIDDDQQIINRVRSEVSPSLPRYWSETDSTVTALAVTNHIDVTIPAEGTGASDAAVGDLMLVAISSTVQSEDQFWNVPAGWTELRGGLDETSLRVYAKKLADADFGVTVGFYTDLDTAGGAWGSVTFIVKDWYGTIDSGVAVSEVSGRSGTAEARAGSVDPPVMFTPWPIGPTLFLVLRAGLGSPSGASTDAASDDQAPPGFDSLGIHPVDGDSNAQDCAVQWARRIRTESVINPGPFGGNFTGYTRAEALTIAVRGFAGDPPPDSGGAPVISNNEASQIDRDAVLTHPNPGRLFETETAAAAYNDHQLTRFDQDRPIIRVGFTATTDEKVRAMCTDMQLSDRVRIDADGLADLGFDAEFLVETITHSWREGGSLLQTEFACSPATDGGGGAD